MKAPIRSQRVNEDTVIDFGRFSIVSSQSEPGGWHEVRDGRCTCDGFYFRGRCRHVIAVEQARSASQVPVAA